MTESTRNRPRQYCFTRASTVPTMMEKIIAKTEMRMVLPNPLKIKARLVAEKTSISYASLPAATATLRRWRRGVLLEFFSRCWTRSARGRQMMKYRKQHMM